MNNLSQVIYIIIFIIIYKQYKLLQQWRLHKWHKRQEKNEHRIRTPQEHQSFNGTIWQFFSNLNFDFYFLLWRNCENNNKKQQQNRCITVSVKFSDFTSRCCHKIIIRLTTISPSELQVICHIPSIAFWHLPPKSARFGYTTEGALFISVQLSTNAVSALQKVWVLIRPWKQPSAQAPM